MQKLTCRLIDRYLGIGDDAVTLTNNDAGRSISMTMIFELHATAIDDEYNFSRYFSVLRLFLSTIFCTCRLVLLFISHSLFCFP